MKEGTKCPNCYRIGKDCKCAEIMGRPIVMPDITPRSQVIHYQERIREVIREAENEPYTGDILIDLTNMRICSGLYQAAIKLNEELIKYAKEMVEIARERSTKDAS